MWVLLLIGEVLGSLFTFALEGRRRGGSYSEVARRHPRSLVVSVELAFGMTLPQPADDARDVVALVATREGLSFRDGFDLELLRVSAGEIMSMYELDGDAVRVDVRGGRAVQFVLMQDGVDVPATLRELRDATGGLGGAEG